MLKDKTILLLKCYWSKFNCKQTQVETNFKSNQAKPKTHQAQDRIKHKPVWSV